MHDGATNSPLGHEGNRDAHDWRRARRPSRPRRRAESLSLPVTPGEFVKRELTARVTARIGSVSHSRHSAASFCEQILSVVPTPLQELVVESVCEPYGTHHTCVVTAREVGGSTAAALAAMTWVHRNGPGTCALITAPNKRRLNDEDGVWERCRCIALEADSRLGGKWSDNVCDLAEAWYMSAFTAADAGSVARCEHERMLVVVDDADRYPESGWVAINELVQQNDARLLVVGRCRANGTWARLADPNENESVIYGKPEESPNYANGDIVIPGLLTRERYEHFIDLASSPEEAECWTECEPYDPPAEVLATYEAGELVGGSSFARSMRKVTNDKIDAKRTQLRFAGMDIHTFAAERLWVRDKSGAVVRFRTWPLQKVYKEKKVQGHEAGFTKFLLLKYRRGGFTTFEQAESYRLAVTQRNARCLTLAHTEEQTTEIFRISQRYQQNDAHAPRIKGVGNARRLEFPDMDSVYFTATASGNAPGRGDTLSRVHGSEVSKWCRGPNQASIVSDLVSGFTEACANPFGEDGEIVMESTPFGVDGWFCPTYREAKKGLNDWMPIFLPWFFDPYNSMHEDQFDEDEIFETMSEEEKSLCEKIAAEYEIVLTMAQIAWRRAKIRALGVLFKQEYPEDDESCFLTSGTAYFPIEYVMQVLERLRRTYERRLVPGGVICIKQRPKKGRQYVAGSDTSEGIKGGDPSNVCIQDKKTGDFVAWAYGLWRPEKLGEIGVQLCKNYNNAFWGIERQNHGHAVIQDVKRRGYRNLYKFDGKRHGWDTNSATRPVMLDDLRIFIEENPDRVHDDVFLGECLTFKLQDNGKFEADPGMHDDTIFGWGICNQMRTKGRTPGVTVG
jgi:hypothetical protein